jgi:hypothetical protein
MLDHGMLHQRLAILVVVLVGAFPSTFFQALGNDAIQIHVTPYPATYSPDYTAYLSAYTAPLPLSYPPSTLNLRAVSSFHCTISKSYSLLSLDVDTTINVSVSKASSMWL